MVKITTTVMAGLVAVATAKSCKRGLSYCGYGLLKRGNYISQITAELQRNGKAADGNTVNNALFLCVGGPGGNIEYIRICNGCVDGGKGKSDYCQ